MKKISFFRWYGEFYSSGAVRSAGILDLVSL